MQQGLGLSIGFMVRIVCYCFHCCHLFEYPVKVNYFIRKKNRRKVTAQKYTQLRYPLFIIVKRIHRKGLLKKWQVTYTK